MNKKDKIIHSALTLFARHGYSETSIDKIAKHAEVSKGLTYTHFKNKDALLRAAIDHSITRLTAEMMKIEEISITSLFANFFKSLRENKEVIRLCILLLIHPETPQAVYEMLEAQKHELLDLLKLLLNEKFKDKSEQEARLLLATLDGITLDYAIHPNEDQLESSQIYLSAKYS